MVSTFTPRLNLEMPDAADPYNVTPHNNNMQVIDDLAGAAVIATSTTRPTPPDTYPGLLVFETDTGMLVLRNGADNGWMLFTQVVSCTSGTRPSSTHPGMLIYETDSRCLLMRNNANTAWEGILGGLTGFNTVNTQSVTASTTYTAPSGMPGLTYVVPPSGTIKIDFSARVYHTAATANRTSYYAPVVRQGATIGGGTVLSPAADDDCISNGGDGGTTTPAIRFGSCKVVPGLTPGNTVNVQMAMRASHAVANAAADAKKLIVSAC